MTHADVRDRSSSCQHISPARMLELATPACRCLARARTVIDRYPPSKPQRARHDDRRAALLAEPRCIAVLDCARGSHAPAGSPAVDEASTHPVRRPVPRDPHLRAGADAACRFHDSVAAPTCWRAAATAPPSTASSRSPDASRLGDRPGCRLRRSARGAGRAWGLRGLLGRAREALRRELRAGGLDGIWLALHGAMVTTECEDPEGELLRRIRAVPGAEDPAALRRVRPACDLHARHGTPCQRPRGLPREPAHGRARIRRALRAVLERALEHG